MSAAELRGTDRATGRPQGADNASYALGAEPRNVAAIALVVRDLAAETGFEAPNWTYTLPKRALDLIGASLGLVLLSPLLLLIALLIKLDSPGPVIFTQMRIGSWGRPFCIFKFRTMANSSGLKRGSDSHKLPDDPRVTRVGKWLRRTSMDELPQLVNVLRGEMSLVGPRPEIVEIVLDRYEGWQYERFFVPQGVTGWWQIKGRGELLHKNTTYDLHYVRNASLLFDIQIVLLTFWSVARMYGAF